MNIKCLFRLVEFSLYFIDPYMSGLCCYIHIYVYNMLYESTATTPFVLLCEGIRHTYVCAEERIDLKSKVCAALAYASHPIIYAISHKLDLKIYRTNRRKEHSSKYMLIGMFGTVSIIIFFVFKLNTGYRPDTCTKYTIFWNGFG